MRLWPSPSKGIEAFLEAIASTRREDVTEFNNLRNTYVLGRHRTDRAVPSANTDVVGGDALGDIVRSGTYEYILVNDAGTLKWARHALDVGW